MIGVCLVILFSISIVVIIRCLYYMTSHNIFGFMQQTSTGLLVYAVLTCFQIWLRLVTGSFASTYFFVTRVGVYFSIMLFGTETRIYQFILYPQSYSRDGSAVVDSLVPLAWTKAIIKGCKVMIVLIIAAVCASITIKGSCTYPYYFCPSVGWDDASAVTESEVTWDNVFKEGAKFETVILYFTYPIIVVSTILICGAHGRFSWLYWKATGGTDSVYLVAFSMIPLCCVLGMLDAIAIKRPGSSGASNLVRDYAAAIIMPGLEGLLLLFLASGMWRYRHLHVRSNCIRWTRIEINALWEVIQAAQVRDPQHVLGASSTNIPHKVETIREDQEATTPLSWEGLSPLSQIALRPLELQHADELPSWLLQAFEQMKKTARHQRLDFWDNLSPVYARDAREMLGEEWVCENVDDSQKLAAKVMFLVAVGGLVVEHSNVEGVQQGSVEKSGVEGFLADMAGAVMLLGEEKGACPMTTSALQAMQQEGRADHVPVGHVSIKAMAQALLLEDAGLLLSSLVIDSSEADDMTQPLAHYYISSTHNTCCMEDQILTECSCDAFEWALLQGAKCLEVDVFDGRDKEPMVCHGPYTSQVPLQDVLLVIRDNAFAVSDFPLILSLDVNASVAAQRTIATLLQDVLGELLFVPDPDSAITVDQFTPEQLRGRIVIRGKKHVFGESEKEGMRGTGRKTALHNGNQVGLRLSAVQGQVEQIRDSGVTDVGSSYSPVVSPRSVEIGDDTVWDIDGTSYTVEPAVHHEMKRMMGTIIDLQVENERLVNLVARQDQLRQRQKQAAHGGALLPFLRQKVPPPSELMRLTSLTATRCPVNPNEMVLNSYSCSESSFNSALDQAVDAPKWFDMLGSRLFRVYPSPQNIQSENFNPQPHFGRGVQMVALNWQTQGPEMALHHAWFRANKGSGYVLKPEFLRGGAVPMEMIQPESYLESLPSKAERTLGWYKEGSPPVPGLLLTLGIKFSFGVPAPHSGHRNQDGIYYDVTGELNAFRWKKMQRRLSGAGIAPELGPKGSGRGFMVKAEMFGTSVEKCHYNSYATTMVDGFGEWNESFTFPLLSAKSARCAQLYLEISKFSTEHDGPVVVAARAFPLRRLRAGLGVLKLDFPWTRAPALRGRAGGIVCTLEMEECDLSREEFSEHRNRHRVNNSRKSFAGGSLTEVFRSEGAAEGAGGSSPGKGDVDDANGESLNGIAYGSPDQAL